VGLRAMTTNVDIVRGHYTASARISSIMRWRSGETLRDDSFRVLLQLKNEANCLTLQPTKQSPKHQLSSDPQSKLPLPRERFSPRVEICRMASVPAPSRSMAGLEKQIRR
jgi:hypothetical protein